MTEGQIVCCQFGNEHRQRKQVTITFRQGGVALGGAGLWMEWCPVHEKMIEGGLTAIEREARVTLLGQFVEAGGVRVFGE